MRKFALLALLAGALAVPAIAAATPTLTGQATPGGPVCCSNFIIANGSPVIDGGSSYLENDKSGNCIGDSGTLFLGTLPAATVVCAHYVASSSCCNAGSPKMRFAVQHPLSGGYLIFRINDNAPSADTWAEGPSVDTLEQATAIVNTGRKGAGFAATDWIFAPLLVGDFQISNPA